MEQRCFNNFMTLMTSFGNDRDQKTKCITTATKGTRGNVSHKVRTQSISQERAVSSSRECLLKETQACLTQWPQFLGAACCSTWRGTKDSWETERRNPPIKHSLTVFPSICHEVMGPDGIILVFWMLSFKPTFSLSSFTFIKRLFSFHGTFG